MAVSTYTRTGTKAATPAKLDKSVFDVEVNNHELLKLAYVAYLANGRTNNAVTLERGDVRGGGRKPWRQKGTGRARFGSIRNPIWRGGGITFGPTGEENYTKNLNTASKRQAIRQALTLAAKDGKLSVIESFEVKDGKTRSAQALLGKLGIDGRTVIVVDNKDQVTARALNNLSSVALVQAKYLNVFDIVNADHLLATSKALEIINDWLGAKSTKATKEAK